MHSYKNLIGSLLTLAVLVGNRGELLAAAPNSPLLDQNKLLGQQVGTGSVMSQQLILGGSAGKGCEIRGYIKTEQYITEKVPQFRVLFAGKETMSNPEGFFSLPLDENMSRCALLICKSVKQNFVKTNTVRNVGMELDENYRYFELERSGTAWRHQERQLSKENPVAPERCLIVLLDPMYVDHIEPSKLQFAGNVISLPSIVLKKDADAKVLAQASASSLLLSLDEKPFHETAKEETKQVAENSKVVMSLVR